MKEDIFQNIVKLVEKKMGKYKMDLTPDIMLEKDLGITGDDAVEFILEFSENFKVDVSNFLFTEYFESEGDSILPDIIRGIFNKKKRKSKELTLGDLYNGAIAGKLNNEVLNQVKI